MTDQEINIAIAKFMGWKFKEINVLLDKTQRPRLLVWSLTDPLGNCIGERNEMGIFKTIPNYCGDLNAMYEAEGNAIEPHFIDKYTTELYMVLERFWTLDRWVKFSRLGIDYAFTHATARQRAEAFCKTLGIWKD